MMLADIATGNTGFADVMFLVGFILALLAALLYAVPRPNTSAFAPVLLSLAFAAGLLAWLVL